MYVVYHYNKTIVKRDNVTAPAIDAAALELELLSSPVVVDISTGGSDASTLGSGDDGSGDDGSGDDGSGDGGAGEGVTGSGEGVTGSGDAGSRTGDISASFFGSLQR